MHSVERPGPRLGRRGGMMQGMGKTLAVLFGVMFALLGALGFVSNPLIGTNALFAADAAHNWIHLFLAAVLLGGALLAAERAPRWLAFVGVITLLLGVSGLLTVPSSGGLLLGVAYTNSASDWFHLVVGACMYAASRYGGRGGGAW